jgi:hypothetical protein
MHRAGLGARSWVKSQCYTSPLRQIYHMATETGGKNMGETVEFRSSRILQSKLTSTWVEPAARHASHPASEKQIIRHMPLDLFLDDVQFSIVDFALTSHNRDSAPKMESVKRKTAFTEPSSKRVKLLGELKVNHEYAKRFEHNKQRAELHMRKCDFPLLALGV